MRATSRLGDNSNPLAAALRHIGPVSEDFYRAFGVGDNAKSIGTVDEGGVALAAIRGLYRQNQALQRQSQAFQRQNQTLRAQLAAQTQG